MQLTDEQIEAAAKAAHEANRGTLTLCGELTNAWIEDIKRMLRAAAPFLQMPLDQPSDGEMRDVYSNIHDRFSGIDVYVVQCAVNAFVECRNASIISKPVDPRREKIISSLNAGLPRYQSWDRNAAELLADRILAALDAKE
jgi:hypothetical protein